MVHLVDSWSRGYEAGCFNFGDEAVRRGHAWATRNPEGLESAKTSHARMDAWIAGSVACGSGARPR